MSFRPGQRPFLRGIFAGREPDIRLQLVLEQLQAAALLAAQGSGSIIAVNGRAAVLTEYSREDLLALSLAEIAAATDALQQLHQLESGQSRLLEAIPLRTRSGRTVLTDWRAAAQGSLLANEQFLLLQMTPVEERQAAESQTAQEARVLGCLAALLALVEYTSEEGLDEAVGIVGRLLSADAVCLYLVSPGQPGLKLRCFAGEGGNFPAALGPGEAHYMASAHTWSLSQRPEGYLHQAARNTGWTTLLAQPVGDGNAMVGAVCAAYRSSNSISIHAEQLLALASQHIHLVTAGINRTIEHQRSRDLAVRLTAQLAAIHAQVQEGLARIGASGTLEEINGAAARMLGYRSEDVTGHRFEDILVGDETLASLVRAALQPGSSAASVECRLLRRNGDAFPATARVQPLQTGGCVVAFQDMSDARANAIRLEHLDQLTFMGQTTQSFAHEVRNPLNGIAMGVQFLASRLSGDLELSDHLAKIQAECTRLSDLMNDMLAWAKPIDPNLVPTDLDALLRRLLARFGLKLERRNVRINYSVEENLPQIMADGRLLEGVFVNLIDNAQQAMPAGGYLSISLRLRRDSGKPMVEVRLADEGPGISEEARRRIFDPYFSTKPNGTGLGLAICKRLVTIHHGAIGVESFPGAGTIFTVMLPAIAQPEQAKEDS
jgi:PAS domain S-box-containing protein